MEAWTHPRRPNTEEGQLVPAANPSHPAGKSLVILVAEDNPISQMVSGYSQLSLTLRSLRRSSPVWAVDAFVSKMGPKPWQLPWAV